VSAVAGLDQTADSRAVAIVDWDLDGDLDAWLSNRTSPRIEFLRNETVPDAANFVAVRLTGTTCNKDAIGTRVELVTGLEGDPPLVRYVSAGNGYLSQSSRWVHFGLGEIRQIDRLIVSWPGGQPEVIRGLKANRRYQIVQGAGRAEPWAAPTQAPVAFAAKPAENIPSMVRLVPHRRLPLPDIPYVKRDGKELARIEPHHRWTLITVWASWCQPCLDELAELSSSQAILAKHDCAVVPLNVDDLEQPLPERAAAAEKISPQFRFPESGVATIEGVERLDAVHRVLISKRQSLPIPSSFLVDEQGRLAVIYKGRVSLAQLERDLGQVDPAPADQAPNEAIPFSGRWYVNPVPADLLAIPAELLAISHPLPAYEYLRRHAWSLAHEIKDGDDVPFFFKDGQAAQLSFRLGLRLAKDRNTKEAEQALQMSTRLAPNLWEARAALAELYTGQNRDGDVLVQYQQMLRLKPNDFMTANNAAWVLATSSSDSVRNPAEAVRLAELVCQRTKQQLPQALDTLAAAYASAGQFEQAVTTAKRAIELAHNQKQADTARRIEERLKLYQNKRAYRSPRSNH
jgi:tetratricopeptide (TPR) repeat protein